MQLESELIPKHFCRKTGPGNIGPQKGSGDVNNVVAVSGEIADDINIWDEREIPDVDVDDSSTDPRERPEFEIKYRQAVTPEDVYLQVW
jgi:hypothetical protein